MRGAGEHERKATLVSLAPDRTCSLTVSASAEVDLESQTPSAFVTRFTSTALPTTINNPPAVPQHERRPGHPGRHKSFLAVP